MISVLEVVKADLFVRLQFVYAFLVRARSFYKFFFTQFSFRFSLHFHVSCGLDYSKKCLARFAVWRSVLLRSCLSNLFLRRWLPYIVLKSHVFGHEKQQPELNFGKDHIILFD